MFQRSFGLHSAEMIPEASKTDGCLAQGCRANSDVEATIYQCHQQKAALKEIITRLFIMPVLEKSLLHSFVREPSGVLLPFYFSNLKIYLFKSYNNVLSNVFLTSPFCLHFKAY